MNYIFLYIFAVKKGYSMGVCYFSCPPWLKTTFQGCLQVEPLWEQRWLILGVHAGLSGGPRTSQLQAETDGHTQALPFFLLVYLPHLWGFAFKHGQAYVPSQTHVKPQLQFGLDLVPLFTPQFVTSTECRQRCQMWMPLACPHLANIYPDL